MTITGLAEGTRWLFTRSSSGAGEGATDRRGAAEAGDPREIQERRMRRFPIFPDHRRRPRYARQDRGGGEGSGVRGDTRRAERRTNVRESLSMRQARRKFGRKKKKEKHIYVYVARSFLSAFLPRFSVPFYFLFSPMPAKLSDAGVYPRRAANIVEFFIAATSPRPPLPLHPPPPILPCPSILMALVL